MNLLLRTFMFPSARIAAAIAILQLSPARTTVSLLSRKIENFSFDLIFGVPGQSLALWSDTLARAVALHPRHISTYGMTFEKGTAFWSRRAKGALQPVAEELERAMYALAMD